MDKSEQKRKSAAAVTLLQHIDCETPGIISQCMQSADIDMRWIRTFESDPIPADMDGQAGLIVMGGPMSVYDHEQFPFLLEEQRLIETALKDDKPVLGVCLGSQLLAATLGAEVKSGTQKEIGWHPVELLEGAAGDRLWSGLPSRFTAFHWHGDIFDLPTGSIALAASDLTPCQGFRYGRTAYGFLFHMEVTETIIKDLCQEFRQELDAENIAAASIIQKIEDYLPNLQSSGKNVFNRWAQLIRPAPDW